METKLCVKTAVRADVPRNTVNSLCVLQVPFTHIIVRRPLLTRTVTNVGKSQFT